MTQMLKILMLEDNAEDAAIIQRLLIKEKVNCEFRLVMDKDEYITALHEFSPDIVLSDNFLPRFNATEALKILRQQSQHLPFILITGTASEEFAAGIIKMGADDYILKDRLSRLPVAIDAALKQRKAEIEKEEVFQKMIQSEQNLKVIFENTSEGFILLDNNFILKAFNSNARKYIYFNTDRELRVGDSLFDFLDKTRADFVKSILSIALYGEVIRYDRYYEKEDGDIWLDFSVTPVREGNQIKGVCITGRDITEQKMAEKAIKQTSEKLRLLASHLEEVREEERTNISREIHDELGQQLTGLKMDIFWLNRRLESAGKEVKQKTEKILQSIDTITKTVRKIAISLRPSILDDLGLIAALEWQSEEFERRSGIPVDFANNLNEIKVASKIATALFRIYQELLTNIARHANATNVTTVLNITNNQLQLTVADNGVGFDPEQAANKKTLGLLGIKERTLLMNGRYEIKSKPGEGTIITITISLPDTD